MQLISTRLLLPSLITASLFGLSACGGGSTVNQTPKNDGDGSTENQAPNAVISPLSNTDISTGDEVILSAKDSSDPDGSISSYQWQCGDDSADTEEFTFSPEKNCTVKLTVEDNGGESDTDTLDIKVSAATGNKAPNAVITPPVNSDISAGDEVTLSAEDSFDPDGLISSYQWQCGDDSADTEEFTFSPEKNCTAKLIVEDNSGASASDTLDIKVTGTGASQPTAKITGIPTDDQLTGYILKASAKSSTDDGEIVSWLWGIDGTEYTTQDIIHTFSENGSYKISLKVTDDQGLSSEDSVNITIKDDIVPVDEKPVAVIRPSATQTVEEGGSISFDGSGSTDEGQLTYSWSTGGTDSTMTKTFTEGERVCLTVTDEASQSDEICVDVKIKTAATSTVVYYHGSFTQIHYWNLDGVEEDKNDWATEGKMEALEDGWFIYDFGKIITSSNVIFHGGGQTETLTLDPEKPCYKDAWVSLADCAYNPDPSVDRKAPLVTATPAAGTYLDKQAITLAVSDDKDTDAKLYFTIDGTPATSSSKEYTSQTIAADDVNEQVDLTVNALAVDASGNEKTYSFNYRIGKQIAGSGDFREENVYFIMTDRFADGDSNNNNIWGDEFLPDGVSKYDTNSSKTGPLTYYHGGDFQGIIDNLDYIQDLGFTAIWITPVVKQPEGRRFNANDPYEASAFHGYWGYDFDQIDPHLHSSGKSSDGWDDFDGLVKALHDRGMKLMLDIVVNHGQPADSVVGSKSKWADRAHEIIMDGQTWDMKSSDPYKDGAKNGFFSYASTGNTWLIDLIDFNINGDPNQNASQHLINVYKRFIDHGVDAFRIDTVSYMPADFWETFTKAMDKHARSKGNDNFYMCGEAWTGDRTAALNLIYNGGGDDKVFHMLDLHGSSMDFPGWMGKAFKGEAGFDDENGYMRIAGADGDASGIYDPTYLSTFVDNHDVTRANGILTETQYLNNLNFIYLFRGLPVVFYGTEIMYSDWPHYITTTEKDDVVARWMLGSEGIQYVKDKQPTLAKHLKMLNTLRRSSVALQKGQQTDLLLDGDAAVIKRDLGGSVAYVAMSKGSGFSHDLSGLADGGYRLITPNTANGSYDEKPVTVSGGSYSLTVSDNSFVMLEKI